MNRSIARRVTPVLAATAALVAAGSLSPAAALPVELTWKADAATLGDIPDSPEENCGTPGEPRDVTVQVPRAPGTLLDIKVSLGLQHTYLGDVTAVLIAPDGTQAPIFGRTGVNDSNVAGKGSNLAGKYVFADGAGRNLWGAPRDSSKTVPTGKYSPSEVGGPGAVGASTLITPAFTEARLKGTWTIRLTDSCSDDTGSVTSASLKITTDKPTG